MSFSPRATVKALQSAMAETGFFAGGVQVGELFSPPSAMTAAIMAWAMKPAVTTLGGTVDVYTLMVRVYGKTDFTPETTEAGELELLDLAVKLEQTFAGGFSLGGNVRAINWAGEEPGETFEMKWGHVTISQTQVRVLDVMVPCVVDDAAAFAA